MTDPTRSDPLDPTADVAPDPDDLAAGQGAAGGVELDEDERAAPGAPAPEDFEDREAAERAARDEQRLEEAAAALAATGAGTSAAAASAGPAAGGRARGLTTRLRGERPGAADAAPAAPATARPETLPYVDDRFSKIWVAAVVAVFALIFLNAIFLGNGGLLTTTPSPSPSPSQSVAPSVSPSRSPTSSPSESPSPSASPGGSPSVSPTSVSPGPS